MRNSMAAALQPPTLQPAPFVPDDLTRVKGIAESREQRLYVLGIYTFAQLVAADPVKLADQLGALVTPAMVQKWQTEAALFGEA